MDRDHVTLSTETFERLLECKDFVTKVASKIGVDREADTDVDEVAELLREAVDIRQRMTS